MESTRVSFIIPGPQFWPQFAAHQSTDGGLCLSSPFSLTPRPGRFADTVWAKPLHKKAFVTSASTFKFKMRPMPSGWLTDWLTDWPTDSLIYWLTHLQFKLRIYFFIIFFMKKATDWCFWRCKVISCRFFNRKQFLRNQIIRFFIQKNPKIERSPNPRDGFLCFPFLNKLTSPIMFKAQKCQFGPLGNQPKHSIVATWFIFIYAIPSRESWPLITFLRPNMASWPPVFLSWVSKGKLSTNHLCTVRTNPTWPFFEVGLWSGPSSPPPTSPGVWPFLLSFVWSVRALMPSRVRGPKLRTESVSEIRRVPDIGRVQKKFTNLISGDQFSYFSFFKLSPRENCIHHLRGHVSILN